MNRILTRAEILAAKDFKMEEVPTPEWGDGTSVFVRTMTSGGRDIFEAECFNSLERDEKGKPTGKIKTQISTRAPLCARCVSDADGNLLFTEADIDELAKKAPAAMERIFNAAQRVNAITEADIKELEGN